MNVPTTAGVEAVAQVARALADAGIAVDDLGLRQPSLDEVFLTLTAPDALGEGAGDLTTEGASA